MKKLFFVFALVLSAGVTTYAQTDNQAPINPANRQMNGQQMGGRHGQNITPEQRAQNMTDRMDKMLTLSADQKKQVYQINLNTVKQLQSMQQEPHKGMGRTIHEQRLSDLKKVLTDDQYQKMLNFQQMQKARMGQPQNNGQMPPQ